MNQFTQARYEMLKPMIKNYLERLIETDEHIDFRANHSNFEADTVLIIETFDKIQLEQCQ